VAEDETAESAGVNALRGKRSEHGYQGLRLGYELRQGAVRHSQDGGRDGDAPAPGQRGQGCGGLAAAQVSACAPTRHAKVRAPTIKLKGWRPAQKTKGHLKESRRAYW
jgi:hypothetical protein